MKKFFVFIVFFLIFSLASLIVLDLRLGEKNLEGAKTSLLEGDFAKAQRQAISSLRSLKRIKNFLSFLPFNERISQVGERIELGEGLAKTGLHLAKLGQLTKRIIDVVLGKETEDLKEITQEAKMEIDLVWENLSLIEGALKKRPIIELPKIKKEIEISREFFSILPEVFGVSQKKTYLILFQNNMELRATGGFIGSYGLVIFENGKLLDFQVEDVYTADGQLKGHVEPPQPIAKYLGEAGWFLRDSNFDPDFPKTVRNVKWFFQKETGRAVDGVIGMNLYLVQKILQAMGPVELSDYQETITASNLFERAEYHSEVGFFPGSTQKRDFLGSLTSQVFQKLNQTKNWLKIGEALFESLEEKQILVSLDDQKVMKFISRYGWDGRILENSACQVAKQAGCFADYLMIVESNFGVNKSNYFLKRKLNHEIKIEEEIKEKLTINYQNNSPSQTWPGGNYKNYLRVYTPLGSQLLEVKIGEGILDLMKVDIYSASGKNVFGFLLTVPAGEEKEVTVKYKLPFKIEDFTAFSLLWQKQSGIGSDPLSVLIDYPPSLKVVKIVPNALTGTHLVLYNTDLLRDRVFLIEFTK